VFFIGLVSVFRVILLIINFVLYCIPSIGVSCWFGSFDLIELRFRSFISWWIPWWSRSWKLRWVYGCLVESLVGGFLNDVYGWWYVWEIE